ncbi:(Na+)-NQR maturation NqrM [Kaarinaea lacus]
MMEILISVCVFLMAVAAMSIGVVLGGRSIQGSCGGLNHIPGLESSCGGCDKPCKNKKTTQ